MKKLLISAAVLVVASQVSARDKFDGCGLGWEITQDKTILATTIRGTTNAVVPPTFGMTTGTIGCEKFSGIASADKNSAEYVAQNYETIRAELAMGQGEYVQATAESLGCDAQVFGQHVQQNYNSVVAPTKDGIELFNNLKTAAHKVCS